MSEKYSKIYELEKRIQRIEDKLDLPHTLQAEQKTVIPALLEPLKHVYRFSSSEENVAEKKLTKSMPSLSFNQVITFLGIAGIIIGMIFFFFYAVANNWIGELAQVAIGVILGFGLFFILKELNEDIFLVIFIVQWLLFSYFSKITKDSIFYRIISYLFLFLIIFWYLFVLRFNQVILHASIFMLVLASIVAGFLFLNKQNIDKIFNGALFIISIFVYIVSRLSHPLGWGLTLNDD